MNVFEILGFLEKIMWIHSHGPAIPTLRFPTEEFPLKWDNH